MRRRWRRCKRLPRLVPGRYNGQPVAVLLTIPVVFFSPRHVFAANEVARAAAVSGGTGAWSKYLQKHLQTARRSGLARPARRGHGALRAAGRWPRRRHRSCMKSLCATCDDEALRLVRAMPRWQPALGYDDQPVAVQQAINVV